MQQLKVMNSKQRKELLALIESQWGAEIDDSLVFLYSEAKSKVYVVTRDIEMIDLSKLHIDSIGLYFGELLKDRGDELRLSIEGSQIVGPHASKNIVDVDDEGAHSWMHGENVFNKVEAQGWAIIRHGKDFLGSGRVSQKVVMNYVPKARRIAG